MQTNSNYASCADRHQARIAEMATAIDEMQREIAQLRGALHTIVEWHLPYRTFGLRWGSNGEITYFRSIARRALNFRPETGQ